MATLKPAVSAADEQTGSPFPLTEVHPLAQLAALAAEAAGQQGQFWPMHDLLYEN